VPTKAQCPTCEKDVTVTRAGVFYKHSIDGVECDKSGEKIPGRDRPPPPPPSQANPDLVGYIEESIPGADGYAKGLAVVDRSVPRPVSQNDWPKGDVPEFSQPALPFSQPAKQTYGRKPKAPVRPMTELGQRLVSELKQMFFHYNNRPSSDNRSAQRHLGPSEIGTPCDRRLALSLTDFPKVNPGGDGWAAFVGTCVHAGVAEMLEWADAGSGRYGVEVPLEFPSVHVPRGTGDELDRVLLCFIDQKMMGGWSLDKLKSEGPSQTYRVQVQTYAYGARLRGEKVESVAIVGWPRDQSTLDDLYAWTEPYDPSIARNALTRVDSIAERIESGVLPAEFPIADDCRYCPFNMPDSKPLKEGGQGCNGRQ
jgi:hypothetical protein